MPADTDGPDGLTTGGPDRAGPSWPGRRRAHPRPLAGAPPLAKGPRGAFTPIKFPGAASTVVTGINDRGLIGGARARSPPALADGQDDLTTGDPPLTKGGLGSDDNPCPWVASSATERC
jgi:hypothetical protein